MKQSELSRRGFLAAALAASTPMLLAESVARAREPDPAMQHQVPPELRMGSEQIAILVYPEFTALDAIGPHYALAGMMGATVRFVAKTKDYVHAEGAKNGGFGVMPHMTFEDCPDDLDLLLVPGGLVGTLAAIDDDVTRQFIIKKGGKAKLLGSVCTGSLILGACGLLKGRRATSHWQLLPILKDVGATAVAERIVFDGSDRVTAAGVSAGLDLGFTLCQKYRGDAYAKGMQLLGEYDPQPPFPKGGNPATADPQVVALLNAMHEPLQAKFRSSVTAAMSRNVPE